MIQAARGRGNEDVCPYPPLCLSPARGERTTATASERASLHPCGESAPPDGGICAFASGARLGAKGGGCGSGVAPRLPISARSPT